VSPQQLNIIQRGGSGSFPHSTPEMQAGKPPTKPTERQKPTKHRIRFASDSDWMMSTHSVCSEIRQRILEGALEISFPIAL
jgi:hypothetical protein